MSLEDYLPADISTAPQQSLTEQMLLDCLKEQFSRRSRSELLLAFCSRNPRWLHLMRVEQDGELWLPCESETASCATKEV